MGTDGDGFEDPETHPGRGADRSWQNRSMTDVVRRRLVVYGGVQGVFFRDSTRERARAEGVVGWVRNRADGAVEAVLEGDPQAVERVVSFCQTGPPQAEVRRVECHEEEPEGATGFEVR